MRKVPLLDSEASLPARPRHLLVPDLLEGFAPTCVPFFFMNCHSLPIRYIRPLVFGYFMILMNLLLPSISNICILKVKVAQSCPTLCDPIDYMVHGILQARILEWVAFPFSRGSFRPRDQTQVSHIAGGFLTS